MQHAVSFEVYNGDTAASVFSVNDFIFYFLIFTGKITGIFSSLL